MCACSKHTQLFFTVYIVAHLQQFSVCPIVHQLSTSIQTLTFHNIYLFIYLFFTCEITGTDGQFWSTAPVYIQLLSRALDRDENKASLSVWHAYGSIHALWSQLRQQIPAGFGHAKKGFILNRKVASVKIAQILNLATMSVFIMCYITFKFGIYCVQESCFFLVHFSLPL